MQNDCPQDERPDNLTVRRCVLCVAGWIVQWTLWVMIYTSLVLIAGLAGWTVCSYFAYWSEKIPHCGWIAGAMLALGAMIHKRRFKKHPPWRPDMSVPLPERPATVNRPLWVTREAGRYSLGGLFIGLLFGTLLSLSCVSIKVSPFVPVAWSKLIRYIAPESGYDSMSGDAVEHNMGGGETMIRW